MFTSWVWYSVLCLCAKYLLSLSGKSSVMKICFSYVAKNDFPLFVLPYNHTVRFFWLHWLRYTLNIAHRDWIRFESQMSLNTLVNSSSSIGFFSAICWTFVSMDSLFWTVLQIWKWFDSIFFMVFICLSKATYSFTYPFRSNVLMNSSVDLI